MNRGEVNTARTANLDETEENQLTAALQWEMIDWQKVEAFINKAQARIAKAKVKGNNRTLGLILPENKPQNQTGSYPADSCLLEA